MVRLFGLFLLSLPRDRELQGATCPLWSRVPLTLAECLFSHGSLADRLLRVRPWVVGSCHFPFAFCHISAPSENSLLFHLVQVLNLLAFYKSNYFFFLLNTLKDNIKKKKIKTNCNSTTLVQIKEKFPCYIPDICRYFYMLPVSGCTVCYAYFYLTAIFMLAYVHIYT